MKKRTGLLLVLALVFALAFSAQAEEFFAEETFGAEESFGEESFFEEEFFAEEESPAEGVTEEALPEEELEDRSVLATNNKGDEIGYGFEAFIEPIVDFKASVVDAKPNEVKLEWQHYTYEGDAKKSIKLPSGFSYIVYERDPINYGVYYQVAKTTKRTVTLKNVARDNHEYFVRAEFAKNGVELYGKRSSSPASVFVQDTGLWKKLSKVSIRQEPTTSNYTRVDPIVTVRTKEEPAAMRVEITVNYQGKTKAKKYEFENYFPWSTVPAAGGFEYEADINLNNYYSFILTNDVCRAKYPAVDKAKSIKVKVTPLGKVWDKKTSTFIYDVPGSAQTVTLSKVAYDTDTQNAKVTIDSVVQTGPKYRIQFTSPAESAQEYMVTDGKESQVYYGMGSLIATNLNLANDGKAGSHKITVAPAVWVYGKGWVMGKEKATYTLNVPKPAAAPVTASVSASSGKCYVTFWNSNPNVYRFDVEIVNNAGSSAALYSVWPKDPSSSLAAKGVGYDEYSASPSVSGSAPYKVIITTVTKDKKGNISKSFISDIYRTDGRVIPVKR